MVADDPPERSLAALHHLIRSGVEHSGYAAIFLLMALESACVPVPSEFTMPVGGWLAWKGDLNIWIVGFVGAFANLAGSWAAYGVGATGGRELLVRYGRFVLVKPHDVDRAHRWFERYGDRTVFWSRLLPVVRTFISLPAGVARMDLKRFSAFTLAGCLPWSFGLAYGGYLLGQNWSRLSDNVELASYAVVALVAAGALLLVVRARRKRARAASRL